MNRRWLAAGAVVLGATVVSAPVLRAQAGASTAWLHVRVEEGAKGAKGSKVSVNLPLPVVEAVLQAAPDTIASKGRIKIGGKGDGHSFSLVDLRRAWAELKNVGDTELVSVEQEDETVKVSRKGDVVQVRVSRADGEDKVRVDVPVSLVDAALSGDEDTIDVKALFKELSKRRGDVVQVNEADSKVRVWIDESNTGGGK
jgi:translation elongation factor EF-1alpha